MAKEQRLKDAILVFMTDSSKTSFEVKDISEGLNLTGADDFKLLVQTLAAMEREGLVFLTKGGKLKIPHKDPVLAGIFRASDRGFGFVSIEDEEQDIYIPPNSTNFALEGDRVSVDVTKPGEPWHDKGPEGRIQAILERNFTQIVGEFWAYDDAGIEETGLYGYVEPSDKKVADLRVFIKAEGIKPVDGSIVIVEITHYPDIEFPRSMQGLVTKVIGHKNDPGVDILTIVYDHGIPTEFPKEVLKQAEQTPDKITEKDLQGRTDLRDETIITIDGADAKDLDDAITVRQLDNGNFYLGVHIADVSYYVTENSAMDREAFDRGTSVYLTDRVIPMLPQRLSNGICSLHPNVDRLTMSCEMEIDGSGNVVKHHIFPSVIRSYRRMTYTEVNQILMDKDPEVREQHADLVDMFELMASLHKILENKRIRRGAVDFDTKEASILVDEEGHPTDIVMRERGVGERLIESFMLAANETVSEHYAHLQVPLIYRIHEKPDSEKMQSFMEFITAFGIVMKGTSETVSPKQLQKVTNQVKGKPEESVISTMLLRSMKQARYDTEPIGHYGLGAEYYSHFTSPIRRYPDLMLHRLIRSYEQNGTGKNMKDKWSGILPEVAEHSSKMERRAVEAERDTDALKKTEYMEDKVGEIFDGVVSSVVKFGLFIELPNTVEGLVHISNMNDDYYHFMPERLLVIGERTGNMYRIGQPVKVRLTKADTDTREIDFELLPDPHQEKASKGQMPDRQAKHQGRRKGQKNGDRNQHHEHKNKSKNNRKNTKSKHKKGKPFYQDVAKKKGKKKRK
ncbi:ribonuclease R [Pisciglobus halotolerans]|uniref:Ribonuclease R n=1 Tax=Pisciglobus halotolerans TaxID=745365 RepID=A0A1I3C125_9LACT|nr:ribonuclease R [Pisciglobus halotolerans]SFH68244.1 RNAse R [Pisciglobus halotolerans]